MWGISERIRVYTTVSTVVNCATKSIAGSQSCGIAKIQKIQSCIVHEETPTWLRWLPISVCTSRKIQEASESNDKEASSIDRVFPEVIKQ